MLLKTRSMFGPELSLLIAACRAAYGDGEVRIAADSAIRWDQVAALAERHRVQALCWHGLGDARCLVPKAVADELSQAMRDTIGQDMRMAGETARLKQALDGAGIDSLFVKGVTLGALAYPEPFLKMAVDIDLLVAPDRLGDAVAVLRSAGCQPIVPRKAAVEDIEQWHRTSKESMWRHPETGLQLDLHTRLADHPGLIPTIGINSPRQSVTVAPGIELPTLAPDELFTYLCVHGASSAWFRLKWSCDLAALLHAKGPLEMERFYDRSLELGAGRASAQALLVTDRTFGLGLSDVLRERLRSDLANRWLAAIALRQLTTRRAPLDRALGTATIHLSQLVMLPGLSSVAAELVRQVRSVLGPAQ